VEQDYAKPQADSKLLHKMGFLSRICASNIVFSFMRVMGAMGAISNFQFPISNF